MKSFLFFISVIFCLLACSKNDSPAVINDIPDQSFTESFDQSSEAVSRGWTFLNKSIDLGNTQWGNPVVPPFDAYFSQNGPAGYLWADYNSTSSAAGVISNWAVSPVITLQNGDKISFYTRAQIYFYNTDSTDFVNRLQVRMNIKNTGTNTGNGVNTGDFNILLLDINPGYRAFLYTPYMQRDPDARQAYPHLWTRFEATVSGLLTPIEGRFAFRYFVEEAGNNGRSTAIGIDEVNYVSVNRPQ